MLTNFFSPQYFKLENPLTSKTDTIKTVIQGNFKQTETPNIV